MKRVHLITYETDQVDKALKKITSLLGNFAWINIQDPKDREDNQNNLLLESDLPKEPGFIIRSGGSNSRPHQCLQSLRNLTQSAKATGEWLRRNGIEPHNCHIFNPLPIHHISGLMPWWRSKCWKTNHTVIQPYLMRHPEDLQNTYKDVLQHGYNITSLVPTQLARLLKCTEGKQWLQAFSIIWVGGAPISEELAHQARQAKINLSPCYGSTETAAMISAQSPKEFLNGNSTSGYLLEDIEVKTSKNQVLQVRSSRLALALSKQGTPQKITNAHGWWESGDAAKIITKNGKKEIKIIGRIDRAINSGGETVYPESLELKITNYCRENQVPITKVLLITTNNETWGESFFALLRFSKEISKSRKELYLVQLSHFTNSWLPQEKPIDWIECPGLQVNSIGKFELKKWKTWLESARNQKK